MKNTIKYKKLKVYKYELLEDFQIVLKGKMPQFESSYIKHLRIPNWGNRSLLFVKRSYKWDGASGCAVDTENFMPGSVVHDALYQAMREGLLGIKWRKYADKVLRDICRSDGMSFIRSSVVYRAVRLFGESSAAPKGQ